MTAKCLDGNVFQPWMGLWHDFSNCSGNPVFALRALIILPWIKFSWRATWCGNSQQGALQRLATCFFLSVLLHGALLLQPIGMARTGSTGLSVRLPSLVVIPEAAVEQAVALTNDAELTADRGMTSDTALHQMPPAPVVKSAGEVPDLPAADVHTPALLNHLPAYYSIRELDVRPAPIRLPHLDSPEMASIGGRASVEVRIWIGESGVVDRVEIVSGDPPFSMRVEEAFSQAVFSPGKIKGLPVPSVLTMEVEYPAMH